MKVYEDTFNGYKEMVEQVTGSGVVTTYHGQAAHGSATSSPVWRIRRIVETTASPVVTTEITYADGKGGGNAFLFKWDDRASLNYL